MEPSAEMIEPRCVNEDTNSTSAGDQHGFGLSQADPHPNFDCFFAQGGSTEHMYSEEAENRAISSA